MEREGRGRRGEGRAEAEEDEDAELLLWRVVVGVGAGRRVVVLALGDGTCRLLLLSLPTGTVWRGDTADDDVPGVRVVLRVVSWAESDSEAEMGPELDFRRDEVPPSVCARWPWESENNPLLGAGLVIEDELERTGRDGEASASDLGLLRLLGRVGMESS